MTPIDDELRAALHGRAQSLAPAPDPLAGIERRAKRIQRNRIGAAVAGSALAVAAIAVAVPALQSATSTTGPRPPSVASAEPTLVPAPVSYALDPNDPWELRGEPVDEGTRATIQREYATRVQGAEVLVTPLFAQVDEPSQQLEVVFLAEVDGSFRWGVAQSSESGPEFLWDQALTQQAVSLAAALPGDEVARLLVVASPESSAAFYDFDDASEFVDMAELAPGVSTRALEGDPATDSYRVDLPDGQVILPAPDLPETVTPGGEGPGTEVDGAAYAFDADAPWAYRGPAELGAANLAVDDERLFVATDPTRDDGTWSQRPLYAADSDAGVSLLVLLHTKAGEEPVVTTTWQRGDREAEQTEQRVEPGQQVIQSIVLTDLDDGSVLLVALASPQAGGIVLDQPSGNRPDGIGFPGVGLWVLEQGDREGMIRLYTEGDGVEYYAEPVDVGPGGS